MGAYDIVHAAICAGRLDGEEAVFVTAVVVEVEGAGEVPG